MNSGNSKSSVEGYVKSTNFEWPVLVDESRATEKAYGISISLQNIYQWIVVDPEGNSSAVGSSVERVQTLVNQLLPKAKLFFEGIDIPARLKAQAAAIELGQFVPGISAVASLAKRGGSSEIATAAVEMFKRLIPMAEAGLERAVALEAEGKKFAAYKEYERVARWFKKTDYEKTASKKISTLKRDKTVRTEITAMKALDQAKSLLASKRTSDKKKGKAYLQAIAKKYPDTEAGKEAARLSSSLTR